jgi:glycosyltransferase involved in cell wall biosynthesis
MMTPVLSRESIRHTVIVHDADPHPGDPTAWVNRWLLREAKAADQVVTLTRAVADQLIRSKVIPEEKISVLFHPDLRYQPEFFAGPSSGRSLRVLFFGRILPYKGLSIFVDAIEMLRGAGVAVQAGVFGEGELGSEHKRLEALGAEIRNGWIDAEDISRMFDSHDVLVVSHTKASQSGVIAAAHGAGLPVIATPVGGLIEQIVPDVTGLIAADATGAALAAVIKRVAEDRFILQRMRRDIIASRGDRSMDRFLSELSDIAFGGDRRG